MSVQSVSLLYFSATNTTESVLEMISKELGLKETVINLTSHLSLCEKQDYCQEELVIIGVPVFSGRVPQSFLEKIIAIKGEQTPVVLVATYGNRHYEDALIELKDFVEERGFVVIAGAALVVKHSIVKSIATERPNQEDVEEIKAFAKDIRKLLEETPRSVEVPGNHPYRDYMIPAIKPYATKVCTACGLCAKECPVGAINGDNGSETNQNMCITCMRCIKVCPREARQLDPEKYVMVEKGLMEKCAKERPNEYFFK